MNFTTKIVIGLEIHTEIDLKTKLFCSCARTGSNEPNTRCCPVCLGMPGSKPVLNKKAVEFALKLAIATKSEIAKELIFSRKSYFYPDMAKNYQISQYEIPICTEGKIKLESGKEIGLTRIHMEEDPASLVHPAGMQSSQYVLVDYNRSGNALLEIVTKPELTSAAEARDFMKQLITILSYLEIFNSDEGIIKADANISIKESNYTRVEVKNIQGFKEIERALNYEIQRQKQAVEEGKKILQETRGWDTDKGITFSMRTKETEADYGYIIDPDLVKIDLTDDIISEIKKSIPELAEDKLKKFTEEHGISEEMAKIISKDRKLAEMYEAVAAAVSPSLTAKWVRRELPKVLNYTKQTLEESGITAKHMIDLLALIEKKTITEKVAQKILEQLSEKIFDVNEYVKKEGLEAVSDTTELEKFCRDAIEESPQAVEEYKAGKQKALNFIVGKVMQKTRGKATPKEVNEIIKKLIK